MKLNQIISTVMVRWQMPSLCVGVTVFAVGALAVGPAFGQTGRDSPFYGKVEAIGQAIVHASCATKCVITARGRRYDVRRSDLRALPPWVPEFSVYPQGRDLCGSAGCYHAIIMKLGGRFVSVFEGYNLFGLSRLTLGMRDIAVGYRGPGLDDTVPLFKWNGHNYVSDGNIAAQGQLQGEPE